MHAAYTVQTTGNGSYKAGTLAYSVQAGNSYELHTTCTSSCTCPYIVSLAQNASTYTCYMLMPAGHLFVLQACSAGFSAFCT